MSKKDHDNKTINTDKLVEKKRMYLVDNFTWQGLVLGRGARSLACQGAWAANLPPSLLPPQGCTWKYHHIKVLTRHLLLMFHIICMRYTLSNFGLSNLHALGKDSKEIDCTKGKHTSPKTGNTAHDRLDKVIFIWISKCYLWFVS